MARDKFEDDTTEDIFVFEGGTSDEEAHTPLVEETDTVSESEPEPTQETVEEKAERLYGDRYTIESVSEAGDIGNATVTHQGTRYIFSFPLKEDN